MSKRCIVTISYYEFVSSDEEAIQKANAFTQKMNAENDCNAKVESIVLIDWGKLVGRELNPHLEESNHVV